MLSTGPETSLAANVSKLDKIIVCPIRDTLEARLGFLSRAGVVLSLLGALTFQHQLQQGLWHGSVTGVGIHALQEAFGQGICCSASAQSRWELCSE